MLSSLFNWHFLHTSSGINPREPAAERWARRLWIHRWQVISSKISFLDVRDGSDREGGGSQTTQPGVCEILQIGPRGPRLMSKPPAGRKDVGNRACRSHCDAPKWQDITPTGRTKCHCRLALCCRACGRKPTSFHSICLIGFIFFALRKWVWTVLLHVSLWHTKGGLFIPSVGSSLIWV